MSGAGVTVWIGNYGQYVIPLQFRTSFTKTGKVKKGCKDALKWLLAQEIAAQPKQEL